MTTPEQSNEALAEFARAELESMRAEALQAKELTSTAFNRAWHIGKACVTIGDRVGPEQFELWAKENISPDYFALYRCTTLALSSPDKPPLRDPAQYKQLQIALGNEPPPKETPRKPESKRFVNMFACISGMLRWWRNGDGLKGVDRSAIIDADDNLEPIREMCAEVKRIRDDMEGVE